MCRVGRNRWLYFPRWARLIFVFITLTSCDATSQTRLTSTTLGPRAAADPLTAVEGYLQRYQPGPLPRVFQTTRLYDRHGALLAELTDEGRRTWVGLARISQHLIDATVATEDATFFVNNGVDPVRIAGALIRNVQSGEIVSGASTITMQLARNLFLGPDQRYDQAVDRKLLEAGLAQELTALYSKAELLEMYLNLLNYGNLAYGPEAAAQLYFGKSAADLNQAEAALLAGIPQQPANLDPWRNFPAVKARQRVVLDLLVRHQYLTAVEADVIYVQQLALRPPAPAQPNRAPHFVQYVADQVDGQLGGVYLRRAGFAITTTLDLPLQQLAQTLVTQKVSELQGQYDLSNAALVALKPPRGEILVMVGSADFNNAAIDGQVNVAVSRRQPGSAIKPILYATALDDNLISPATVLWDIPVSYTISAGQIYAPRNYDNKFHGPVTVRTALANSYNVPTVKLLAGLGIEEMLFSARQLGLRSLDQPADWYGLSLTLGGGEVTLLDLTTAYHTLASAGRYQPATPFLQVTGSLGNAIKLGESIDPALVLTPATAFLVTDILSDNAARTPMFGPDSLLKLSQPAAAKTGTTTDFRDNWTVGYTRYLVTGVWAGNSDGRPMRQVSGITGAAPIWHDFMQAILADPALLAMLGAPADDQAWQFVPPPEVTQRPECPPGLQCRSGGEYFSHSWLTKLGAAGPLADSVVQLPTAAVFVQQGESTRRLGYCGADGAAVRSVLQLPQGLARTATLTETLAEHAENMADLNVSLRDAAPAAIDTGGDLLRRELQQVMLWSLQSGGSVYLGRCTELQDQLPTALALDNPAVGLRILVDLAGAADPAAGEQPGSGAVEIAASTPTSPTGRAEAVGRYTLALPITHDADCPGQYIMGRVINRAGAPVPGVHITARDQWGNQADTVSKGGATDLGMFDFPLPSTTPQEIQLWVVDEAGRPLSATFGVPHKMAEAQDAPCHHVVLLGE